ncbi:MAG: glycosyltransferase family 4 protein [Candidatus Bathyarchaeota archaeon]|jgi:glycosyltransferase involved in cell wall biosynthesis|nr:glycosyltransferase family 4 protein [Candidatus Bathyarchaeota archaeon A05DMB-5]MDH7557113.1 glycosyltransferase family 4 protein [Candidatus Bathyarchaeota archaeon]
MTDKLTVMMLTWEFPPRIIGGISPHVYNLSRSLAKNGTKVYVVTCDFPGAPQHEVVDGVEVFRVDSYKNPSPDFATWVYLMNVNMQKETAALVKSLSGKVDVFHAHDWLVANAGIGLKHVFRKPLLATMHSTEIGRRNGIHFDYERMIHETEAWLTYEAWKVVCCSNYMVSHVQWAFGLPADKLVMIPNGVDTEAYTKVEHSDLHSFRSKFALPEEKIVLFVGRLVYEKGVQVLVNAIPKVLEKVNAKFVIVGNGYMKEQLSGIIKGLGLSHKVLFTGFVDDETLKKLQKCADVSVVPSLFEPFGIVALEAMAAKSPVVVSDTGGLSEIVEHDVTGVKTYVNNPDSLAWGITKVLLDEKYTDWIRTNAYKKVQEKYDWNNIAQQTKAIYQTVLKDYSKSFWA